MIDLLLEVLGDPDVFLLHLELLDLDAIAEPDLLPKVPVEDAEPELRQDVQVASAEPELLQDVQVANAEPELLCDLQNLELLLDEVPCLSLRRKVGSSMMMSSTYCSFLLLLWPVSNWPTLFLAT